MVLAEGLELPGTKRVVVIVSSTPLPASAAAGSSR